MQALQQLRFMPWTACPPTFDCRKKFFAEQDLSSGQTTWNHIPLFFFVMRRSLLLLCLISPLLQSNRQNLGWFPLITELDFPFL